MKCSKCGAELTENMKFCTNCGVKIESQDTPEKNVIDKQPISNTNEKSFGDKLKEKAAELWGKLSLYGKFTTIAIAVFTLLCLVAFLAGKALSGTVALISLALVIVALLIKKEIIKTPKRWLQIVALILAVVLIIPYFSAFSTNQPSPDIELDTPIDASLSDFENIDVDTTEDENAEVKATEDENTEVEATEAETQNEISSDYVLDYSDAASFEEALNDGVDVTGKLVQFDVNEYHPDSALGINCWSGEHLNFISEEELDVDSGSIVVGYITEEPTKLLGSWTIHHDVLSIDGVKVADAPAATPDTQPTSITMTMGEEDFKGMDYKEAEKLFREMGFTSFEYRTVDSEIESDQDTICYIEIKEWFVGDSDFVKGDKFDTDSTVTFFSYKYEEPTAPSPVFYSTNDYETATTGDSGVFSYADDVGSYDVYWMIDFDEGYVYYFTDGDGENFCDRFKIESGNLNTGLKITYHDGDMQWSNTLHFHYEGHPETLIVVDQNGVDWKYTTTDLDDALAIRSTKNIKDY